MSASSKLRRKLAKADTRRADAREVGVPSTHAGRLALLERLLDDGKLSSADEAAARRVLGRPEP